MSDISQQGRNRRALLTQLAKSSAVGVGLAAAHSSVVSTPAFADSGTATCRYTYLTGAAVSIQVGRVAENSALFGNDEWFRFTQSAAPTGVCPCGGLPTITYSYRVVFSSPHNSNTNTKTASGLSSLTTAQIFNGIVVGAPGPPSNFNYNIQLGVYVDCQGMTATTARLCRFVTVSGTTALSSEFNVTQNLGTFTLTAASAANLSGC